MCVTISNHLQSIGFSQKLEAWVPHELNETNKENRLQIAAQHLARHQSTRGHKQRFLYRIVTGDEKWCLYVNMKQRKEWMAPGDTPKPRIKQDLDPQKAMICELRDFEGCVHRRVIVVEDLRLAPPQLRPFLPDRFPQSHQNSQVGVSSYCRALLLKFIMNDALVVEEHRQHDLDFAGSLPRFLWSRLIFEAPLRCLLGRVSESKP
ncbi:hypothetical protein LAZ67_11001559 [Cordylochernes scorpioides]|uniref:Transposase n=1 Tax=Cordylochernes scorpioides TaxID=51811 RepID=A0ABY6L1Y6_9ARAC|nr:hypothetical protein LAZ67_11001559 [Cordylochernes scorpioides]